MAVIKLHFITIVIVCVANIDTTEALNTPQVCPQDYEYHSYQNKCYRFEKERYLSWTEARNQCKSEGADLMIIRDKKTSSIVEGYMSTNEVNKDSGVWIGLRKIDEVPNFQWIDGTPVEYSQLIPDNTLWTSIQASCVLYELSSAEYYWRDLKCDNSRRFVCEKPTEISLMCPSNYAPDAERNMCYKVQQSLANFKDSRYNCQLDGGDLVILTDALAKKHATSLIAPAIASLPRYWIGLTRPDQLKHDFEWLDGTPQNVDESTGFNYADREFCGTLHHLDQGYLYTDKVCSATLPSICQKRLSINKPVFECPYGYKTYVMGGNLRVLCLKFHDHEPKTWSSAIDECSKTGGELFTFENYDEYLTTFISYNSQASIFKRWGARDKCVLFDSELQQFGREACELEHPYICQHLGTLTITVNMTSSASLIGDICQAAFNASENGTMYLNHTSLVAGSDVNQLIAENHKTECLSNVNQSNCCVNVSLNQSENLINQTLLKMSIPMGKVSCLCPQQITETITSQEPSNETTSSKPMNVNMTSSKPMNVNTTASKEQHTETASPTEQIAKTTSPTDWNAGMFPVIEWNTEAPPLTENTTRITSVTEYNARNPSPVEQSTEAVSQTEWNAQTASSTEYNAGIPSPVEQSTEAVSQTEQNAQTTSSTEYNAGIPSPVEQSTEAVSQTEQNAQTTSSTEYNAGTPSPVEQSTEAVSQTEQNAQTTSSTEYNTEMTSPIENITENASQTEQNAQTASPPTEHNTEMTSPIERNTEIASPIEKKTFDLLRNVTTPKKNSAVPHNLCACGCDSLKTNFNPSPEDLSLILNNIKKELKVNTENLSAKRNKKNSAKDNRVESSAIGFLGILLCLIPLVLLVALDFLRLFQSKNKISAKK